MSLDILNPTILKNHKPKGGFCVTKAKNIDGINYDSVDFDFGLDVGPGNTGVNANLVWERLADQPISRSHFAMEYWNGSLWILGGYVSGSSTVNLIKYNIAGDDYTTISVTGGFPGTSAFASGIKDGEFWIAGGTHSSSTGDGATNDVWKIDLTTFVSTKLGNSAPSLMMQGCFGADGQLFREGGNDNKEPIETISNQVSAYDTDLNTWNTRANTGVRFHDQTLILMDGLIYSSGGKNQKTNSVKDQNHSYNYLTNTWTELADLPWRMNDHAGVAYDGNIILFGGASPIPEAYNTAIIYNADDDEWSELIATPVGFSLGEAAIHDGVAYVASGSSGQLWKLDLNNPDGLVMAIRLARGLE